MGRWSGGTPSLPTQLPTKRAPDGLASLRAAVRSQPAHTHSHRAKREEPGFRNPFCSLLVVTLNELLFCHLCHGGPVCLWESGDASQRSDSWLHYLPHRRLPMGSPSPRGIHAALIFCPHRDPLFLRWESTPFTPRS